MMLKNNVEIFLSCAWLSHAQKICCCAASDISIPSSLNV